MIVTNLNNDLQDTSASRFLLIALNGTPLPNGKAKEPTGNQ